MKVVMVNGCFDPFHYGHLVHFYEARCLGTRLVVALTDDRYVNKGPNRPHFTAEQRKAVLMALRGLVDDVYISEAARPDYLIARLRPEVYCKGSDYRREDIAECAIVESYGGRVVFTDTPKWSSTAAMA